MAAGNTYTQIASTTVGTATNTVTFSSIPATYTDLVIIMNGTATAAADVYLNYNTDTTSSNYSNTYISGNGSTAGSGRDPIPAVGLFYTTDSNIIANIMNYSNSTTYKTCISRGNTAASLVITRVMMWRNTAAINEVVVKHSSGNFNTGSTFNLYGITAA
jgi:hypothetical protein